jgi:hypothetical protein
VEFLNTAPLQMPRCVLALLEPAGIVWIPTSFGVSRVTAGSTAALLYALPQVKMVATLPWRNASSGSV